MPRRPLAADARVERNRSGLAREWRALKRDVRAETGLSTEKVAFAAGVAGLAMGLELARRWLRSSRTDAARPGQSQD